MYKWAGYTIGMPIPLAFQLMEPEPDMAVLGDNDIILALDKAFVGMRPGQVRLVQVPDKSALSYPKNPEDQTTGVFGVVPPSVGPEPTSAGGAVTLDFVMQNESPEVDKTLLFVVNLVDVQSGPEL
jgi:hypothetical protein